MAGWHHRCNGHELGWTLGDGEGQRGLACCSPWGSQKSWTQLGDWTQRSQPIWHFYFFTWMHGTIQKGLNVYLICLNIFLPNPCPKLARPHLKLAPVDAFTVSASSVTFSVTLECPHHYGISESSGKADTLCVCLVAQSYPTLCDPMKSSLPGSSVPWAFSRQEH